MNGRRSASLNHPPFIRRLLRFAREIWGPVAPPCPRSRSAAFLPSPNACVEIAAIVEVADLLRGV